MVMPLRAPTVGKHGKAIAILFRALRAAEPPTDAGWLLQWGEERSWVSNSQPPCRGGIQVLNGLNARGHEPFLRPLMSKKDSVKVNVKINVASCIWALVTLIAIVAT